MKYVKVLILVFSMSVVACEGTIELGENTVMPPISEAGGSGKADALGGDSTAAAAPDGGALYQQYCSACHGADATGGASFPGSIVGYSPIEPLVVQGDGTMPPIPLETAQIAAIQTFLVGGGTSTPAPTPSTSAGSTPGLQMYATQCASCHGAEGGGTPSGPQLRFRDPGLVRFTVREGRNGTGNPTAMPIYDRATVTDADLDEATAWLDAFPNPTDGEGLYNQYCANCHALDGTGGPSFRPILGTIRAQSIIRSGHGSDRYDERTSYMPSWTADQISDDEILLIEQYMRDL